MELDTGTSPGTLLAGRYRLTRVIGSGGFGRVWEAVDENLARSVAVKEVTLADVPAGHHKDHLDRARREGRNAAALADHPNVVSVYDVLVEGGRPWIVMQLVRGVSLREKLLTDPADPASARRPLHVAGATTIAEGMLSALAALHAAGIRHRDVKPGNILLTDDGRALLTDFGIAKAETDATVTASGSVMGTMAYIAPERAEGHDDEPKSDLFSLGVTLFEAVEGTSPFGRKTNSGTLTAILTQPLPAMRLAGPLAPLISALTIKDPQRRPSIAEAQALLRRQTPQQPPPTADARVFPPPYHRQPQPKPPMSRTVKWEITAAVGVAALVIVLFVLGIFWVIGIVHGNDTPTAGLDNANATTHSPGSVYVATVPGCPAANAARDRLAASMTTAHGMTNAAAGMDAYSQAFDTAAGSFNAAAGNADDPAVRTALQNYATLVAQAASASAAAAQEYRNGQSANLAGVDNLILQMGPAEQDWIHACQNAHYK